MSFNKTQDLKNLLQAMKNAKLDCHTAILNDAHLTEGDFEELLNVEFKTEHDLSDDFEGDIINFVENSFEDCTDDYQKLLLNGVIEKYTGLTCDDLNTALGLRDDNKRRAMLALNKSDLESLSASIKNEMWRIDEASAVLSNIDDEIQGFLK